jgi:hypothetical protein
LRYDKNNLTTPYPDLGMWICDDTENGVAVRDMGSGEKPPGYYVFRSGYKSYSYCIPVVHKHKGG